MSIRANRAASAWLLLCGAAAGSAQTYFDVNVPATPPAGFVELTTFQTPTGSGANRKTVARVVTTEPATGVIFQVVPSAGKTTVAAPLDGAVATIEDPGAAAFVADVRAQTVTSKVGVYVLMRVSITYTAAYDLGGAAQTWSLQAQKLAGARQYFGYVATGTDDPGTGADEVDVLVTRPKVASIADLNFGDVQTNLPDTLAPVKTYVVQNTGTGTLTLSGSLEPAGSVFDIQGSVVVTPMEPRESVSVPIRFKPTALGAGGANTLTASVASNDPASPANVKFTGRGVTLDGIVLIDLSGSMGCRPSGPCPSWPPDPASPPELETRLWQAKQAGLQLYQVFNELTGGKARFGLYGFPDPNVAAPSSLRAVPINTSELVTGSVQAKLGTIPPGLNPLGWTPMAEGIKISYNDLNSATGDYRPVMLLLSDGAHNVDSTSAPKTPDDWIPNLKDKGIRVYTVGYGEPGGFDVDELLLERLSSNTGGTFWSADSTSFDMMKKGFRESLKDWLGLASVADPRFTITSNGRKSHTVCIDNQARAISFVVDWNRNQQGAIDFSLRSPQGVVVSPGGNASRFQSSTYTMWIVKGDLVRLGAGAGQWTLDLTGASNLPGALDYSYSVHVQSFVNTAPKFSSAVLAAGRAALLEWPLNPIDPVIRKRAKITLRYNKPEESFSTWLATSKVDPAWIVNPEQRVVGSTSPMVLSAQTASDRQRAPDIIKGERATLAVKKRWALENIAKVRFGNKRSEGSIQLYDDGTHGDKTAADGIFTAVVPELRYDGVYEFLVDAVAEPVAKACFQRSIPIHQYVQAGLTAASLAQNTHWRAAEISPFFEAEVVKVLKSPPPEGTERRMIVTTPRDSLGNYFGIGHANSVKFEVREAKLIGRPQDLLDGSYAQVVEYSRGARPIAVITAGDVTSAEIPAAGRKTWIWIVVILIVIAIVVIWFLLRRTRTARP